VIIWRVFIRGCLSGKVLDVLLKTSGGNPITWQLTQAVMATMLSKLWRAKKPSATDL